MQTSTRVVLLIFVALGVILGIGFYAQLSWATSLWPWPDSYLSYVFLSSYAVAIAGGVLWVALSGSLGAACYFLYGVFQVRWDNAGGQLLGFLGYDLILIIPFLRHFANVPPGHLLSLIVYVIVLVYSGALAIYYLFINRSTRRWAVVSPTFGDS